GSTTAAAMATPRREDRRGKPGGSLGAGRAAGPASAGFRTGAVGSVESMSAHGFVAGDEAAGEVSSAASDRTTAAADSGRSAGFFSSNFMIRSDSPAGTPKLAGGGGTSVATDNSV